ncbi:MAG: hypothetical protein QOF91_1324 [Alphaproteobacteria bacterium]|jgi:hypothetical protein|nr:hypothetical protein [Alphaproteobacteria bacterium]MEA3026039.1 hypothetical protein [Alphaproteobacteria bacterium]
MLLTRLHKGTAAFWAAGTGILAATAIAIAANSPAAAPADEDAQIAMSLASMLRAGRTVVSRHQDTINDANLGNKGFDSKSVVAEALAIYRGAAGVDPMSIDPNSRHGKLIRMQMDAIAEVIDSHQETINRKGVGFKGFIPAVFGRLTNESFGRRAVGLADMKVTAPQQFIRNAKAKADDWESSVIREKLLLASWPKDQSFATLTQAKGKTAHRTAVPEYYGATCLSCHGSPQGEIDITGYPKEGGHEGDLGGVISITLYK